MYIDEETPEEYIDRIKKMIGPDIMHVVPNKPYYLELIQRRPDLNLVIKDSIQHIGIDKLVLNAIEKANKK